MTVPRSMLAHIALRAAERLLLAVLIGIVLWAASTSAGAQDSAPEYPGPGPRVQLIVRADSLRLTTPGGRDLFAIAEDGSVELSGGAMIDFSPSSFVATGREGEGFVRVRIGGRNYRIRVYDDPACGARRCPQ